MIFWQKFYFGLFIKPNTFLYNEQHQKRFYIIYKAISGRTSRTYFIGHLRRWYIWKDLFRILWQILNFYDPSDNLGIKDDSFVQWRIVDVS